MEALVLVDYMPGQRVGVGTGKGSPFSFATTQSCRRAWCRRREQWCNGLKNLEVSISFVSKEKKRLIILPSWPLLIPTNLLMILRTSLKVAKEDI